MFKSYAPALFELLASYPSILIYVGIALQVGLLRLCIDSLSFLYSMSLSTFVTIAVLFYYHLQIRNTDLNIASIIFRATARAVRGDIHEAIAIFTSLMRQTTTHSRNSGLVPIIPTSSGDLYGTQLREITRKLYDLTTPLAALARESPTPSPIAPVAPTAAPASPPIVPLAPTAAPIVPVAPTAAPASPPIVPVAPTAAPASPLIVPVAPTAAPASPPIVPVAPTVAPIVPVAPTAAPTSSPIAPTVAVPEATGSVTVAPQPPVSPPVITASTTPPSETPGNPVTPPAATVTPVTETPGNPVAPPAATITIGGIQFRLGPNGDILGPANPELERFVTNAKLVTAAAPV